MSKNKKRRMYNQAMVCIETSCGRFGVKHYNGTNMCRECGNQMFPEEDRQPGGIDAPEFSTDMLERISAKSFIDGAKVSPIVVRANDTFQCAPDLKGCPIAKKPKVYIPLNLFNQWIFLAGQLSTEWIAYLTGKQKEGKENEYEIENMYFPKQKATGASCEAEDGEIREGTIAAVHSHVGMNVFFSSIDENHFNHQIELVVNNKGEILATGRIKLECGRYHRGPAEMIFTGCEEELGLMNELKSKLTKEQTFTTVKSRFDGQETFYGQQSLLGID